MDNSSVAERVLSRRFGVARAREIAGDLLEQYSAAGARWEMIRLAFGIRPVEFLGLLLACVLVTVALNLLFSPWQLHFMAQARSLHDGWASNAGTGFASYALYNLVVAMAAAVRLGLRHDVTRCSVVLSGTLGLLSVALLPLQPWRVSWPILASILLASILLWQVRTLSLATICRSVSALAAVTVVGNALLHTMRLAELRSCIVNLGTRKLWPPRAWFDYYTACSQLALHHLLICVAGALVALWFLTFTEARPSLEDNSAIPESSLEQITCCGGDRNRNLSNVRRIGS